MEEIKNTENLNEVEENEMPLDKTVRLMSPTRMVVRRFFRSKLSIVGLVMVISLFLRRLSMMVRSLMLQHL